LTKDIPTPVDLLVLKLEFCTGGGTNYRYEALKLWEESWPLLFSQLELFWNFQAKVFLRGRYRRAGSYLGFMKRNTERIISLQACYGQRNCALLSHLAPSTGLHDVVYCEIGRRHKKLRCSRQSKSHPAGFRVV